MASDSQNQSEPEPIEMPAPTAWPIVLAIGLSLAAGGLVTNLALSAAGTLLAVIAGAGWARQVFTTGGLHHEKPVPESQRPRPAQAVLGAVQSLHEGMPGHRMRIPEKIHPYSAGIKGGIIGGLAMMVPALIYGLASGHGPWYPVNLLAGMVLDLPRLDNGTLDISALDKFNFIWFVLGIVIHGVTSVTLGLLYGVILPMLPGHPIFWGGVVAPLLWTGAIYSFMGAINRDLYDAHDVFSWLSFIASQFIYGLVAGLIVIRSEKVYVDK